MTRRGFPASSWAARGRRRVTAEERLLWIAIGLGAWALALWLTWEPLG